MPSRTSSNDAGSVKATSWSDRSRDRAQWLNEALLKDACRNAQDAAGDVAFLYALAAEIALTRGPEIARGRRSVVAVMPGFRNTRERQSRPADPGAVPCVILVVRRKRRMPRDHPQTIPQWLVTYADRNGRRLPFALPTDVQDASEHQGMRMHAASEIGTQQPGFEATVGHFAALLQIEGDPSAWMLSAMHVLSPQVDADNPTPLALDIFGLDNMGLPDTTQQWCRAEQYGGRLVPDPGNGAELSFDVQLAQVAADQRDALVDLCLLRGINRTHPCATDPSDLAEMVAASNMFELLRAQNNPFGSGSGSVPLRFSNDYPDGQMPSRFGKEGGRVVELDIFQRDLLRFDAFAGGNVPIQGDSGSAIVQRGADGSVTLVAMHVAGDGQGASVAIPAWTLLDTDLWSARPPGFLGLLDPELES